MKQLTNYINAVSSHLATDAQVGKALALAQPIIMKMKPQDRTVWFHTNIAPLVAQSYKVEVVMTRNGTTSFNDKSGKRADTALSKFRYVTQIKSDSPATKSVSKQVDKVQAKSKAIKSWGMTKAQVLKAVELAYAK